MYSSFYNFSAKLEFLNNKAIFEWINYSYK
jgi:hypothetical protein